MGVISTPMPIEMMHLMGTMQPIAMIPAPQGTYTGATISIGSVNVMYMDPTFGVPVQATIPGPINVSVGFGSPVTVGSTPVAVGFDLDLAKSVTMTAAGAFSMAPVFNVTAGAQGSGNPMDPSDGGIDGLMGMVSGVSGSSFTMASMQAAQGFTFATNSSTVFDGTSMGTMAGGVLLLVDATLQSDGTLLATRVRSMMGAGGVMGGGIITALNGQPPTSLTMVMQNGAGMGMMSSMFAGEVTVDLAAGTSYEIDDDNVDMTGLPFTPVFDASHIYAGQSVMPASVSGMMSGGMMGLTAGTMTASSIELEPQGLSGTVSLGIGSGTQTSFTLTLPAGCAFTTLTGATSVTVYQQPQTVVVSGSSITSGSTLHVFGLLFQDAGQWKMVAARMGTN
ncbi:MAG: hypothetical protein KGM96_08445 [Acidobacteriota bacterium]|nr:hypothetical protein [Acidobacteriota bacterium]